MARNRISRSSGPMTSLICVSGEKPWRFTYLCWNIPIIQRNLATHRAYFSERVPIEGVVTSSWKEKVFEQVNGKTKIPRDSTSLRTGTPPMTSSAMAVRANWPRIAENSWSPCRYSSSRTAWCWSTRSSLNARLSARGCGKSLRPKIFGR